MVRCLAVGKHRGNGTVGGFQASPDSGIHQGQPWFTSARNQARTQLGDGRSSDHLRRLEKDQSIISRRRGLYKRFYKRLDFEVEEQEILGVLFQETERDLLLYLLKTPDATQKELSEFAHISASSTSWHMKRLVEA